MTAYDLIVFDWDGTLMDSTGHIVHCMRRAIDTLKLPPRSDSQISHIIGLGLPEAVRTLYPESSERQARQLADTYRETWLGKPDTSPLFPNARDLLERLAGQNLFLGVATGKSRRGLDRVLRETGLQDLFIATRCADECHSKPHPQMIQQLMDYVGVTGPATLMVGDTEFDLLMARNAGAHGLGVSHGAHDEERLRACMPQAILHDLHQVENWLTGRDSEF